MRTPRIVSERMDSDAPAQDPVAPAVAIDGGGGRDHGGQREPVRRHRAGQALGPSGRRPPPCRLRRRPDRAAAEQPAPPGRAGQRCARPAPVGGDVGEVRTEERAEPRQERRLAAAQQGDVTAPRGASVPALRRASGPVAADQTTGPGHQQRLGDDSQPSPSAGAVNPATAERGAGDSPGQGQEAVGGAGHGAAGARLSLPQPAHQRGRPACSARRTQAPVACRTQTFGSTYVAVPCSASHHTGARALGTSTGPVCVERQAGPRAPLLERAGDDHRAGRDLVDHATRADVDAQPRVDGEAVVADAEGVGRPSARGRRPCRWAGPARPARRSRAGRRCRASRRASAPERPWPWWSGRIGDLDRGDGVGLIAVGCSPAGRCG